MLIVPADSRFSQGRWPVVTLSLVLINCIVLFGVQGKDGEREREAMRYYAESGLGEIESAHYLDRLERYGQTAKLSELKSKAAELKQVPHAMEYLAQRETGFQRALDDGSLVPMNDPQYSQWQPLRAHYNELEDRIVGHHYAFDPAHPRVVTVFTHMFLHGGFDHLLGNMIMLIMVGIMVEYAMGPLLYPLLYLAGGLCALGAYWLVNLGEYAPMLGASGAIASMMGAFAVRYGARKVRFFYTVAVYFDFIMLPAIVLLPYWVGWEVLQHFIDRGAHVAYEAHAGGLLGGAALAWLTRQRGSEQARESLDRPDLEARWQADLHQAMGLMGKLDFPRARVIFEQLREQKPEDLRPLLQLYRIAKADPASEDFHRHAQALLSARPPEVDNLFDDYLQYAQPQPRLAPQQMMMMLNRYAAKADIARVDRVLGVMVRQGSREREVGAVLTALAARVPEDKARAYRALAARLFA